jgi:serine/threonine-protein kinase
MRLRLDRLSEAVASRRNRSLGILFAAIVFVLFAAICLALAATAFVDDRGTVDARAALFCFLVSGVLPVTGAIALFIARARYDRATRELHALFTESTDEGRIDRAALEAKGWSRERADSVLLDALALGLLADDEGASLRPGPMFQVPPTPPLPLPAPVPSVPPWAAAAAPAMQMVPPIAPGAIPTPRAADAGLVQTRAARPGSDRPVQPQIGSVLTGRVLKGTYMVEEELGKGGMGAVWAARHLRTGRRYAVKTLLSSERFSRDAILRFEREARSASAVGHSGIVAVHDFDRTEEGIHFLVMDLLTGETLENRLARSGRLGWSDARRIAIEMADALAAAHRAGILHRDLKPANVFLAQLAGIGERAVLVDFGLAKPIEESASQRVTTTGAVVGTALYMSPEQAKGEKLDVRSDVYGLGAVVYEMVAGVPPFLGPSAIAVMTMVLAEQPVAPSVLARGIPPELDALLLRTLSKTAPDRPQDVAELARLLAAIPA